MVVRQILADKGRNQSFPVSRSLREREWQKVLAQIYVFSQYERRLRGRWTNSLSGGLMQGGKAQVRIQVW